MRLGLFGADVGMYQGGLDILVVAQLLNQGILVILSNRGIVKQCKNE